MTFGVTDTGFNPKLITDILDDIETREKTAFGPQINTGGEGALGQMNTTMAASIAEAWEVLNAVYRSLYPDSATGEALDNVSAITGASRLPATKSTISLDCTGTTGTVLPIGRVVSVDATGDRFVSTAAGTITSGTVSIPFESEEYGPIPLNNGQALTIETPVSGWDAAAANEDATLGDELETDADFRLRRTSLLRAQGSGTIEAIKADIELVDGVYQTFVFENVGMITDSSSLPPKSIEVLVYAAPDSGPTAGIDDDIADAIFASKPAGIETYGHPPNDVSKVVTDSMGYDHDINFTRPDEVDIHIVLTVTYDTATYPADGDDQIKAALVALGDTLTLGQTVVYERFQAEVFTVDGVVDSTVFYIDKNAPGTGQVNLFFDIREIATFQTADIDVTSNPVV